ncbi:MAG TPA: DUF302 domain-containing protein, partial [Alphaproteobacteria bacterium]|nr:DUF302 domain-containing protein [Alphaproteobacteria bacterium]
MNYHMTKTVPLSFDTAIDKVTEALKAEGFGILTDIDVKATLHKKLDIDFRPYRILGACNPPLAHEALEIEDKVGVLLPCNVVVQETKPGEVEVSAMDPVGAMEAIGNDKLTDLAKRVKERLNRVLEA